MIQKYTCIVCPNGCDIEVEINDAKQVEKVTGNLCPKGEEYVRQETAALY